MMDDLSATDMELKTPINPAVLLSQDWPICLAEFQSMELSLSRIVSRLPTALLDLVGDYLVRTVKIETKTFTRGFYGLWRHASPRVEIRHLAISIANLNDMTDLLTSVEKRMIKYDGIRFGTGGIVDHLEHEGKTFLLMPTGICELKDVSMIQLYRKKEKEQGIHVSWLLSSKFWKRHSRRTAHFLTEEITTKKRKRTRKNGKTKIAR